MIKLVKYAALAITLFTPFCVQAQPDDVEWAYRYEAKALPNAAPTDPIWEVPLLPTPDAVTELSGDRLLISTSGGPEGVNFYRLSGGPGREWVPTPDGSTMEVRIVVVNEVIGDGTSQSLFVATGKHSYQFRFSTEGIRGVTNAEFLPFNTSNEPHTYRFTFLDNGSAELYINGDPEVVMAFQGEPTDQAYLDFGDRTHGQGGACEWQYIRWTNAGVFPPHSQ